MVKASWNGIVIAESNDTIVVEGNHYFDPADVKLDLLKPSDKTTVCGWKGTARYYTIAAGGAAGGNDNVDAAWTYPETKPEADNIRGRIAFWKGVEVA